MGSKVKVEPILVLCLHMDSFGGNTRAQYIRVPTDGTLEWSETATGDGAVDNGNHQGALDRANVSRKASMNQRWRARNGQHDSPKSA